MKKPSTFRRKSRAIKAAAAAAAALVFPTACQAATSGNFSILSMNVAGLPALVNGNDVPGDKAANHRLIGQKFNEYGYDVIHVQEDFNYHAHLYSTNTHPHRTPTSGGVPLGSGLNTLSRHPYVDFRRVKWDKCSNQDSADCLTPKGFTFMRVALGTDASSSAVYYADFYNLHADAGVTAADLAARQDNVRQLADHMARWSAGNAVVVFGDFNSRYSRGGDTGIRGLLAAGLRDPWVELRRGGRVPAPGEEDACGNPVAADARCETVDKVFYRSGPLVRLAARDFAYDGRRFLQADGKSVLSDHNPVRAELSWEEAGAQSGRRLRQSALFGGEGEGAAWFNDAVALERVVGRPRVAALRFRGGSRLDGVGLTLRSGEVFRHGGSGGTEATLALGEAEFWTEAELCKGERSGKVRNFYIRAVTSAGRTLAAGTRTSSCATFRAPSGWHIVGFVGQDGDEVDQLAFVYAPM
ncbi:hypothetical protein VTJ83DRAFT_6920 [Remersonia thermophila]|uniref:Jacalin-type lectin domain-containing protein n=1 Tax=Remersonia thermophila TaxID=72144 RepID=A0ABR4D672_9PEZI